MPARQVPGNVPSVPGFQKLIDLYPLGCAKKRKKLMINWVAQRGGPPRKKESQNHFGR
jgi:hypothetical protein